MVKIRLLQLAFLFSTVFLFVGFSGAQEQVRFTAMVKNLGFQASNPLISGLGPEDEVSTLLEGTVYEAPRAVAIVVSQISNTSSPQKAATSIFSANRAGDVDWIAGNFVEDEREQVREFFADKEILDQNTSLAKSVKSHEVLAALKYNGFAILIVRSESTDGRKSLFPLVLRMTPSGWKQTNALSGDKVFDVVFTALRTGTWGLVGGLVGGD